MKVTKVWRETIKQGDSVGGEEGAKKKKEKEEDLLSCKSSLMKSVCMPFNS